MTVIEERPTPAPISHEIEAYSPSGLAIGSQLADLTDSEFVARLEALRKQQERIRQIQQSVMVAGADYGNVPGTDRPTLLKGGAEKLCNLYGLVARIEVDIREGDPQGGDEPALSIDATCYLHVRTFDGPIVGIGRGNANSWEKKYRYVTVGPICPDCGRAGVRMTRRHVWWHPEDAKPDGGCGGNFVADDPRLEGQKTQRMFDPDPLDKRNTLIKMAEKRAHVDATLRATATSALFTQDVEDLPPGEVEDRRAARVASSAPKGSAAWLAANLTNEKIPPSVLNVVLDNMGQKGRKLTDLTDDQRLAIWEELHPAEIEVEPEAGLEAADAAAGY